MARLTQNKQRTAGFRFSGIDAIAIAIVLGAAVFGFKSFGSLAMFPLIVLGHFFLFCNIFRVRRNYELIWALIFVLNCSAWFVLYSNSLTINSRVMWLLVTQTPVTVFLIGLEMRSPNYHGVFARRINSRLDEYLAGTGSTQRKNASS